MTLTFGQKMGDHTTCSKCGAEIQKITAELNRGRCAPCWKNRPLLVFRNGVFATLGVIGFLLALPFLMIWELLKSAKRNITFPHSKKDLIQRILKVHTNHKVARLFLRGVVDGYAEPREAMLTGNPRNEPYCRGCLDGSALRRGDIDYDAIPTDRSHLRLPRPPRRGESKASLESTINPCSESSPGQV